MTLRWDPNKYYQSGAVGLVVMVMKAYSTLSRTLELEPHHQTEFNVIFRTSLLESILPFCIGYSQCILSSTTKAVLKVGSQKIWHTQYSAKYRMGEHEKWIHQNKKKVLYNSSIRCTQTIFFFSPFCSDTYIYIYS